MCIRDSNIHKDYFIILIYFFGMHFLQQCLFIYLIIFFNFFLFFINSNIQYLHLQDLLVPFVRKAQSDPPKVIKSVNVVQPTTCQYKTVASSSQTSSSQTSSSQTSSSHVFKVMASLQKKRTKQSIWGSTFPKISSGTDTHLWNNCYSKSNTWFPRDEPES